MFIVIEGIEGSGKTTLAVGLARVLREEGREVLATREPGGTPVGDAVREIFLNRAISISPLTESMLVNAARAQHVSDVVRPALAAGRVVLCDRFTDSTLAYQGYGRGLDLDALRAICAIATGGLAPDLTLVVDVPLSVAKARMRERPGATDRIESEDEAFHERVRQGFLQLAKSAGHYVLDGTVPPERLVGTALEVIRTPLRR